MQELNLKTILNTIFRHKIKILLITSIIFFLGNKKIDDIDVYYSTDATMLINFSKGSIENMLKETGGFGGQFNSARSEIIRSYMKILSSRNLIYDVIKSFEINDKKLEYTELELSLNEKYNKLKDDLTITADLPSNTIRVNFKHKDANTAKEINELIVYTFIEKQNEMFNLPQTNFLNDMLNKSESELKLTKNAFQDFKIENKINNIDVELEELLVQKNNLMTSSFGANSSSSNFQMNKIQSELDALISKYNETVAVYSEDSKVALNLLKQIESKKKLLNERRNRILNSKNLSEINYERTSNKLDQRLKFLQSKRNEYFDLEAKIKMAQKNYNFYYSKLQEAIVNESLVKKNFSKIVIVDYPIVPEDLNHPNYNLLKIGLLIFSLGTAFILIIFFELIDDRIREPQDIKNITKHPLLAVFFVSD